MDYRVRGFTRDVGGRKHFIDHNISSIQNYLSRDTKNRYQMVDVNVYQENLFHTKMVIKDFRLDDYLFCVEAKDLSEREHQAHPQAAAPRAHRDLLRAQPGSEPGVHRLNSAIAEFRILYRIGCGSLRSPAPGRQGACSVRALSRSPDAPKNPKIT
jgi:hypothetical protein